MRRWLLFATFFVLGLAALLWVTRRAPDAQRRGDRPAVEPSAPERFATLPGEGQKGGAGLHLDGALSIQKRTGTGDTKRTEYKLTASDVDFLEGDSYDVHDLVLTLYDAASGRERARLESPLTRLRLPVVDGEAVIAPDESVRFNNVELVLLEGAPLVPLTLRMPLLEWTPATHELRSSDRVQLQGDGALAEGSGLEASLQRENLRLLRNGSIDLDLSDGARARLEATGAGVFDLARLASADPAADPALSPATIEVHVSDGARLTVTATRGAEPFDVSAQDLVLRGVQQARGAKAFRLLSAVARGSVVAHSRGESFAAEHARWDFDELGRLYLATLDGQVVLQGGLGRFDAQKAEFRFTPDGRLERAELAGSPAGVVELGSYLPRGARELDGARAHLSGAGPLVLKYEPTLRVDLDGPAELEIPEAGVSIRARKHLGGNVDARANTGSLLAEGEAEARWNASHVEAPAIDLRYALNVELREVPGQPRGDVVGAITTGRTTATLALEAGLPIELVAEEGLEARSTAGHLTVPLAKGVRLERKGAAAFVATARRVRDFDHAAQSFSADGDVSLSDARGRGRADRVVCDGPNEQSLFGTAHTPARWDVLDPASGELQATAQAVEIRVHESSLEAQGAVTTDVHEQGAEHHLECAELLLERRPEAGVTLARSRAFHALARGAVHASSRLARGEVKLDCDELEARGRLKGPGDVLAALQLEGGELDARGGVHAQWSEAGQFSGDGDRFQIDSSGKGRLSAAEGGRVRAEGRLPGGVQPYELGSDWLDFDPERLDAANARLRVLELPAGVPVPAAESLLAELSAGHLHANRQSLVLDGHAHARGSLRSGEPWTVDADRLRLDGRFERGEDVAGALRTAEAQGTVVVHVGADFVLRGDRLAGSADELRVEGQPASLELADSVWESPWIEYHPRDMLLSTGRGVLRARDTADERAWRVEYESLQPFDQEDSTILVLQNPVFRQARREMRATWALFWVDREEWRKNTRGTMQRRLHGAELRALVPEPPRGGPPASDLRVRFAQLRDDPLARILSEVYVEGGVELIEKDLEDPQKSLRRARADAFYLDLRQGMGWLQQADLVLDLPFRGRGIPQSVRATAAWMRVKSDFSLSADDAVITSCTYDEPHYMIETGHLRITASSEQKKGWNFEARKNALRFGKSGLTIPLPTIDTPTDEHGNPLFITNLFAGNSSKFGTSVRATINLALGSLGFGIGRFFGGLLQLPTTDLDGHWEFDVGILGTRGILLGAGIEFAIPEKLRLGFDYSVIPDSHEDKGLVRVPESDRDLLRQWFRLRGRRFFGPTEWMDVALSWQTDPGVQAEFFEREYLFYEQKDTYLHWRRAQGATWWSASAKVLLEDRTDVEELPSGLWSLGRRPVGKLGSTELLYGARASAGYYQRRDGDANYHAPFPDGEGDRDVLRFDTEHRLEAPFPLGFAGARVTPFASARVTGWSASTDGNTNSSRALLEVGADAATTFWRSYPGGTLSTLSPRLSVHGDVVEKTDGARPLVLDETETVLTGTFVDAGLRARWWHPRTKERLDIDLEASQGWNVPGHPDGWQQIGLLGEFLTFVADAPVGLTHDMRMSTQAGETIYSRSFLGVRPMRHLGVELGYHYGIDAAGVRLYEAASLSTRYTATRKWELEFSQTLALDEDQQLDSTFTLRRLAHDFVLEVDVGFRAGEGSNFGLKLVPNLAYRRSSLGLIDRWLGQDD